MSTEPAPGGGDAAAPAEAPYSRLRLTAGILGRCWLWFLAGCLVVTLVPVLFGWRPYLIESGSMQPRIQVGDVVIASPEQDPQVLLGRVAVFTDPDRPDREKTHRVIQVADDGTLVTKGDANPTADSQHVAVTDVQGLGRLLVRFVGLPVIWLQTGQWLWLLLFLASVVLSVRWVGRDHEDETPDDGSAGPPDDGTLLPAPGQLTKSSLDVAATRPGPLPRSARARWAWRAGYATALAAVLVVPTSTAAFSATTRNTGNTWAVPDVTYTAAVGSLKPWLYWKLDESNDAGPAADSSGHGRDGEYTRARRGSSNFVMHTTGALTDSPNYAVEQRNDAACVYSENSAETSGPARFTVSVWFKAPPGYDDGGKLIGFERPRTGVDKPSDGQYDRMLYLDGNARLWFGVYNGGYQLLSTSRSYDDNAWHLAVGTLGSTGMALYVDGALAAKNDNSAAEVNDSGWWRAGCGNLAGWGSGWSGPNGPPADTNATNFAFLGSLDEVAVWDSTLTAADVAYLYFAR
jgi:signal peptidase I